MYNLESENPAGYAQLHVLMQTFLVYGTSASVSRTCKCHKYSSPNKDGDNPSTDDRAETKSNDDSSGIKSNDDSSGIIRDSVTDVSDCPSLSWLQIGLYDLISHFSLCGNRVVEILLVYYQHWIFVLKHELLRVIRSLISKEKLEEVR